MTRHTTMIPPPMVAAEPQTLCVACRLLPSQAEDSLCEHCAEQSDIDRIRITDKILRYEEVFGEVFEPLQRDTIPCDMKHADLSSKDDTDEYIRGLQRFLQQGRE